MRQRTEPTNMCSDQLAAPPSLSLSSGLPFPRDAAIVTFGRLRTSRDLQVFKGKKELLVSDFKSRLEVMELSEEGVSEAETGLELGLLHQTVNQGVKEIKSAAPGIMRMIRKRQPSCWCRESSGGLDRRSNQPNIPLSQSLIQRRTLISSIL